jgi:tetratricopeptide (TPR) repeat protein
MLVTRNCAPENRTTAPLALLLVLLLAGCGAPGPRALLKGEDLIQDHNYQAAIPELKKAAKLLPRNAQAWNHLGLAHHGAGQLDEAQRAYKEALRLDVSLASARYNLGVLSLEQNDVPGALEHLTSYTTFQPNNPDGWIKLGSAQLRARRFDHAEKSYKNALDLRPRDPEALNGLGTVAFHRRRIQEAVSHFNSALAENPKYAPAVHNVAVIHHSQNNREQALNELKQYAALAPLAPNIDVVHATIEQLESELHPAPPPVTGIALPKTNVVQTQPPATRTQTTAPPVIALAPRTNPPSIAAGPRTRATPTNPPPTTRATAATNRAEKPTDVPVTRLEDDLQVTPVQDVASARQTNQPITDTRTTTTNTNAARDEKRSLLARINPFAGRSKTSPTNAAVPEVQPAPITNVAAAQPSASVPSYPRYRYASPRLPKAGNHREAERHFARGVAAQRAMQLNQALGYYQQAVEADPAYFDAYYNLGLAAYDLGRWKQSLGAYEVALALKPDSINTRYNFALALKQAGHPLDAAEELKQILKGAPSETRAHLSLANLYAQQLAQPRLARQHYLKVLELEPSHPKGSEIRYWLAANP